jgi:hypothetical protein
VDWIRQDTTALPTGISYDTVSDEWDVTTLDNTYSGTFPVMARATVTHAYQTTQTEEMMFTIDVVRNTVPTWQATPATFFTQAYWDLDYTFTKDSDLEGDIPIMDLKLFDSGMVEITPSWWAVT